MSTLGRRHAIRGLLRPNRGEVGIAELATELDVSEMTIRRDLEDLEDQGVARRVRGGAISTVSRSYEPPLAARANEAQEAKRGSPARPPTTSSTARRRSSTSAQRRRSWPAACAAAAA